MCVWDLFYFTFFQLILTILTPYIFYGIHRFSRPILHGLCTFGYATRAVVACLCGGDPNMVQSMQGRFLLHVFPGETVITEMWADKGQKR